MPGFSSTCPECHRPWDQRLELVGKAATDFSDCAFRCHHCGLAFSNASSPQKRVQITRTPELNVPSEVRAGLQTTLAGAANVGNRTKKRKKFCSATSEDAVTWTVMHALIDAGSVDAVTGDTKLGQPEALLLWGYPVAGPEGADVAARLLAISDDLGEHVEWRSEPDVVALWPGQLVFVEAKYGSGNDRQPNCKGYATYLPAPALFAADDDAIKAEGSYQLLRNWVIGTRMADDLSVALRLVNLGPPTVGIHAAQFAALLVQTADRSFEHRLWGDVLAAAATTPAWFTVYANARGLYSS